MPGRGTSGDCRKSIRGALALLVVLWSGSILAQPEYRFERLSLEHGLSQSSVFALAQDQAGYLWIATEQGADRFDGHGIETLRHDPGSERSLSHSSIRALFADAEGSVWIGTWNGLNRVDSRTGQVRQFPTNAPAAPMPFSVQNDGIGRVCSNRLLVLTRHGPWIMDLDNEHFQPLETPGLDPDEPITSWLATDTGNVWLANGNALWRLDCDTSALELVTQVDVDDPVHHGRGPSLLSMTLDQRLLWASQAGLMTMHGEYETASPVPVPDEFDGQGPLAIHADSDGRVWALLSETLVAIDAVDPASWMQVAPLPEPVSIAARHHLESARSGDGLTWLAGSFGLGVVKEQGRRVRLLAHDPQRWDSLPPTVGRVGYRIMADRFGVLWVGANLGGLARYVPQQHRFARLTPSLAAPNHVVRAVTETRSGDQAWLWLGLEDSGVEVFAIDESEGFQPRARFGAQPDRSGGLPDDRIVAMARQPDSGRVWILGNDWLVWHEADPATGNLVAVATDKGFRSARALHFSRDGKQLFVTTNRNLWSVDAGDASDMLRPVSVNPPLSPRSDLYPIIQLQDGQLAVGCRQGLHLIDPDSGRRQTFALGIEEPGSPARFVFSLAESADGRLWLGTHGGGLLRLQPGYLGRDNLLPERWTTADGLADDTVYAILEDDQGCVWLSGNRGLSQLCPEQARVRNFSLHDGLQAYEFNGRVADIGPTGLYYFGGINGINVFRPERIQDHPQSPMVHLSGVSIGDQVIASLALESGGMELHHHQNDLTIDYLGLHFAAPDRVRYAYRLFGLETDWVEAGHARRARYPALPPGDYRFELRAANPDGVWSEPQVMFEATIRPPPWRTGPAYFGYFLILLAGLVFITWTVRQRRLQLEALVSQRTRELAERSETVSRQAAELEGLLQSRQTLFANVSHELRTPLTLIHAGLDRLKKNPNDSEALELGERYIQRIDRLVDQLLDLSRVRDHAFNPEPKPWPLTDWLRRIAHDYAALAKQSQLQLDFASQGQWQTRCNRELLEKCLTNLLSNALKYTPPGGQIFVRLGGTAEHAEIEVADTGPGIAPEQQATIFERFERLPAHENQAEKGAGIGLALVHEAIQALDGEIHLHSRPGEGSRFILTIPAQQIKQAQEQREPETAPIQSGQGARPTQQPGLTTPTNSTQRFGTLLIVEDNHDLRRHLKGLLSDQWKIITAGDGQQALTRLAAHDIDVIVSDIMMPNMDGLDLLKRIRNDIATSHIPFLILTARRDADTRLQGLKLAADGILTKPFNDEELRLRLTNSAQAIERRRRHDRADNGDEPAISPQDQAFIDQLNTWLEAHHGDPAIRINDLAQHLKLDERSLQRKTRALFGKPPKTVLTEYRLDRSAELLRDTDRKVADVSAECGFSSASYFGRQFAKRFGKAPGSWKKAKNGEKG
jgi:signal transduction histidine kinase/DNA-binding response OmpR family regulator/ligand-binding sensor domain-containing protein